MEIILTTDGTLGSTSLKVDGKEITKNNKIVSIRAMISAPFKGRMTGDVYRGGVNLSYEMVDEKGIIESKSIGTSDVDFIKGIGQKIKQDDQVIQYIGQSTSVEINNLVDSIIKYCDENKIPCPTYDVLVARTKESLMDKITDLGIKLEA